ncbi:MAG: hypothetical protein PHQ36_10380, partial [Anaerolineales bacterium]|nr:hypothetical protein [Anaerolineales bacterium]
MPLDITLTPLYRINGQDAANLPGLLALTPPPNAARGRERDRLIVYLLLAGNSVFSTGEYNQTAQDAADMFYQTPGALTTALRAAAEFANAALLQRNMSTSAQGQYAVGWLTLAALRDSQVTFSLSGPAHIVLFGENEARHIHEPLASGKGLGASQSASVHYAQATLSASDRLLFFGRAPSEWYPILTDATPSSLDATRRRLVTSTRADLNAVLMQAKEGAGILNLLSGTEEIKKEDVAPRPSPTANLTQRSETDSMPEATPPSAHIVQPAAYAPPQTESRPQQTNPAASLPRSAARDFPPSIPRINKPTTGALPPQIEEIKEETKREEPQEEKPEAPKKIRARRETSEQARKAAKMVASTIQAARRVSASIGERLKVFLPRLLPNTQAEDTVSLSTTMMVFMTVLIPLIVVTIASVVYLRYGRSQQYEAYFRQAQVMRDQAVGLTDPIAQRKSWENVLLNVDIAESHRQTAETMTLPKEAEDNLDKLLGITRMQFSPAFSSNLGIEISRMAASDTDLYLLDAAKGEVLRALPTNNGRGFQIDTTFNCKPNNYGDFTVGPLTDILTLPSLNLNNATLLGIDAAGNLLYCAPGQVAQAIPLPTPDTNWGRVTAFTMDGGNLYVLDALSRAVWVYTGKDGTFIDRPYFFFGSQTPEKQDVIDLAVSG